MIYLLHFPFFSYIHFHIHSPFNFIFFSFPIFTILSQIHLHPRLVSLNSPIWIHHLQPSTSPLTNLQSFLRHLLFIFLNTHIVFILTSPNSSKFLTSRSSILHHQYARRQRNQSYIIIDSTLTQSNNATHA